MILISCTLCIDLADVLLPPTGGVHCLPRCKRQLGRREPSRCEGHQVYCNLSMTQDLLLASLKSFSIPDCIASLPASEMGTRKRYHCMTYFPECQLAAWVNAQYALYLCLMQLPRAAQLLFLTFTISWAVLHAVRQPWPLLVSSKPSPRGVPAA